ncbi:hypothetical protein L210DRAFT_2540464 [Boletus edulis BED1]|uniref:Uncharacterized protein n=1 Tax=Boletus edulis BED1 TaxID=1328754 RepID=A0AAD4BN42_BOLED|nr:hypothetical protein L210DRAFT_2540464 [Boletus edulis BED1]
MSRDTTTAEESLPAPVTQASGHGAHSKGRIGVERSAAPPIIALASGLVAISSNKPRAVLLFIGAGTVILGLYFVVPPGDDEKTHPIISAFLHRLPDIMTAVGCALILLGIGVAFPNEPALILLFLFICFVALAAFFGMILAVWITATLYGAALVSLVTFVVLAFMA